jgi:hypothetical protein
MTTIQKQIILEQLDTSTGEIETTAVETHTYTKTKTKKYAWLFIEELHRLWLLNEMELKLFTHMITIMDGTTNTAAYTAPEKKLVIQSLTEKELTPRSAGMRFSQLVSGLCKKGVITKVTTCSYLLDPDLISYGFDGFKQIEKNRAIFNQ